MSEKFYHTGTKKSIKISVPGEKLLFLYTQKKH